MIVLRVSSWHRLMKVHLLQETVSGAPDWSKYSLVSGRTIHSPSSTHQTLSKHWENYLRQPWSEIIWDIHGQKLFETTIVRNLFETTLLLLLSLQCSENYLRQPWSENYLRQLLVSGQHVYDVSLSLHSSHLAVSTQLFLDHQSSALHCHNLDQHRATM